MGALVHGLTSAEGTAQPRLRTAQLLLSPAPAQQRVATAAVIENHYCVMFRLLHCKFQMSDAYECVCVLDEQLMRGLKIPKIISRHIIRHYSKPA
jgi:hypothetical protein